MEVLSDCLSLSGGNSVCDQWHAVTSVCFMFISYKLSVPCQSLQCTVLGYSEAGSVDGFFLCAS